MLECRNFTSAPAIPVSYFSLLLYNQLLHECNSLYIRFHANVFELLNAMPAWITLICSRSICLDVCYRDVLLMHRPIREDTTTESRCSPKGYTAHTLGLFIDYERFNCSNIGVRSWSWNYRGCWHQTCPPIVTRSVVYSGHIANY